MVTCRGQIVLQDADKSYLDHPFLTDQLIAYIGNKRKLLRLIDSAIDLTQCNPDNCRFVDLFSGSGSVARLAKLKGFQVVANDWEPYSYYLNSAWLANNTPPLFTATGGLQKTIQILNDLPGEKGYLSRHYCPSDDDQPDHSTERQFYTQQNGRKLDAMRETIERWRGEGNLSDQEYFLLVGCIIWGASWCSNTSGVFKGFHRGWGGATRTAWYRIRQPLQLRVPVLFDNGRLNTVYQADAAEIASAVDTDIVYLDPPYNQHQYGSNYHLLNTVALWDKPKIPPLITQGKRGDKAAIRRDWRTLRNSPWCHKHLAMNAMQSLLSRMRARWILVSYSTDGIIPISDMVDLLGQAGSLTFVHKPYKRYRVSSQRPSRRGYNLEFVLAVETGRQRNMAEEERFLQVCSAIPAV